jgi:Homeodomain-like domain
MGKTKKGGGPGRSRGELASKRAEALELRQSGYSYREIGETMGLPTSTVFRLVAQAIGAIPREGSLEARQMVLDRLDRMTAAVMRAIDEGATVDAALIHALLQIEDHRARLFALSDYAGDTRDGDGKLAEAIARAVASAPFRSEGG